jgi:hypothetical protein
MMIIIIVLMKFGDRIFDKDYKASNILLFVTTFLFITILIVHLFREQTWTADTLKILIGALLGAGSSKLADKKSEGGSSVDISGGSVTGDVAGRDINKNIQNIKEAISKIEGSIVHQNNQIRQFTGDNPDSDFLINTIYERGKDIAEPIERVVQHWHGRGWRLKHFSSDYQGMDGIYLVFSKSMASESPEIFYYHGSNTTRFNEPA